MTLVYDAMKEFYKTNELDVYMTFVESSEKGELFAGEKYVVNKE